MFGLHRSPQWIELGPDEIRKRARILVVDDAEFPYIDLFRRDGYTIDKWPDATDLQKLESGFYDLVLLDMKGVGKDLSRDQGLGLLKHLKKANPVQMIVAYSSATFSLKDKEFFDLADGVLAKTADYVDFKRRVDELLARRFSIPFYIERLEVMAGPDSSDRRLIRRAAEKAIQQQNPNVLVRALTKGGHSGDAVNLALQVLQVAIGIAQLVAK